MQSSGLARRKLRLTGSEPWARIGTRVAKGKGKHGKDGPDDEINPIRWGHGQRVAVFSCQAPLGAIFERVAIKIATRYHFLDGGSTGRSTGFRSRLKP